MAHHLVHPLYPPISPATQHLPRSSPTRTPPLLAPQLPMEPLQIHIPKRNPVPPHKRDPRTTRLVALAPRTLRRFGLFERERAEEGVRGIDVFWVDFTSPSVLPVKIRKIALHEPAPVLRGFAPVLFAMIDHVVPLVSTSDGSQLNDILSVLTSPLKLIANLLLLPKVEVNLQRLALPPVGRTLIDERPVVRFIGLLRECRRADAAAVGRPFR
ncbi:hypothetical protein PENSPDRAFT_180980 [Peniophora sp. CONT]|nr:hypothetical protein PENSPDRAFT_180980 [Peniophora sp. CONT]